WVSHGVVASTATDIARFADALFSGSLLSEPMLERMLELQPVLPASEERSTAYDSPLRPGVPSYGLGVMGDPSSPWGLIVGHNGGGPCYSASMFHAVDLDGVTVCAMGAIERGFNPEELAARVLDHLSPEVAARQA